MLKSLRLLVCAVLATLAAFAAPTAASASPTQLSLIQDDRELYGFAGEDPAAAMAEIRDLGVDVVRTNVVFYKVYPRANQRRKPRGFDASDPDSPQYDWSRIDRLVALAQENDIQVLMTVTGPGPHFTSQTPKRCRAVPCQLNPKPREFGAFAAAVAKRYRGDVDYYSLYNEPNLEVWLRPQQQRTRFGTVYREGVQYRKLWQAGYRSIARFDGRRRNRVLFGEVAAISSPLPMLYAALCLDSRGRPFSGRLRRLHDCSRRPPRLNIGGFAVHPYNNAGGCRRPYRRCPVQSARTKTSVPSAYMPRLHRLADRAKRRGRIGRKSVFITEYGFQSNPPDDISGLPVVKHAQALNEADRLFFSDRRVKSVAQYELVDVPEQDQFNTGLRFVRDGSDGGRRKPAYEAYRMPLVVTRRSANSVEVWGQARPAGTLDEGPFTTVAIQTFSGGQYRTVRNVRTNRRGIFRVNLNRGGAAGARYRLAWQNTETGEFLTSRVARAGKRLRYRRG